MNKYDELLAQWANQNAETIYQHLETNVNPKVDWRNDESSQPITNFIETYIGWPSELDPPEPYLEYIQDALNDYSDTLGISIPKEIIAYRLSQWAGQRVPITHPLIANHKHWHTIIGKLIFDIATEKDATELVALLHQIAAGEAAEHLPSVDEIAAHYEESDPTGHLYTVNAGETLIYLAIADDKVAAMNDDGVVKILDFDGNILPSQKTERIQSYILGGLRFSRPLTDRGELASLVGNSTADLILGTDGLSVFDLPQY